MNPMFSYNDIAASFVVSVSRQICPLSIHLYARKKPLLPLCVSFPSMHSRPMQLLALHFCLDGLYRFHVRGTELAQQALQCSHGEQDDVSRVWQLKLQQEHCFHRPTPLTLLAPSCIPRSTSRAWKSGFIEGGKGAATTVG